jgi:hypothetical protein
VILVSGRREYLFRLNISIRVGKQERHKLIKQDEEDARRCPSVERLQAVPSHPFSFPLLESLS